jgi:hypothetical protein
MKKVKRNPYKYPKQATKSQLKAAKKRASGMSRRIKAKKAQL